MTVVEHAVVCSSCGELTGEYSDTLRDRRGRCCIDLPELWHKDPETGRYGPGNDDSPDTDDDRPSCPHCGNDAFYAVIREWRLTEYRTRFVSGCDDGTVYIDPSEYDCLDSCLDSQDREFQELHCASCHEAVDLPWDWE